MMYYQLQKTRLSSRYMVEIPAMCTMLFFSTPGHIIFVKILGGFGQKLLSSGHKNNTT